MNMDMRSLGYDDWFGAHADALCQSGQNVARVMTVDRGAFLVRSERGEMPAELSGKYRHGAESVSDLPCVGDWVCVEHASSTHTIIHTVLPRKSCLRRKAPGKTVDFQMIAANLDVAFVVQSCHYDFNVRRLERYLVVANESHIDPVVILTKTDLVTPDKLAGIVERVKETGTGARVLAISNTTGHGLDEFGSLLQTGKTHCLIGSSGVGKTTLINRLLGRRALDTKTVSGTGEGVHTTSRRQLLVLDNGAMLIDTPGMRELGLLGASDGVESSFPDIHGLAAQCRFSNCTHTQEPGCAVRAAIDDGELSEDRIQSYLKLQKESEYHDLSYAEKRKKDRDFGRFIKSVQKRLKH